jgi:nicotinate-nucleotide adenylyltransferase
VALIKHLKKQKNYNIFYIIGSDNLLNLHKWKDFKNLIKMTKLIVFSRKGFDTKAKKSVIFKYLKKENFKFFKNMGIDISSTRLRNKIIDGSKKN